MLKAVCKAKVSDDDIAIAVEEEIFQLEIAMNNLLLMDIPDCRNKLGEEFAGIAFSEVSMREDVVEKLASRSIIENNANVFIRLDCFIEPDDAGMMKRLKIDQKKPTLWNLTKTG